MYPSSCFNNYQLMASFVWSIPLHSPICSLVLLPLIFCLDYFEANSDIKFRKKFFGVYL